jgi:hypothetical protein
LILDFRLRISDGGGADLLYEAAASAVTNQKSKIENRKCLGLRVAGVVHFHALREQALAAVLTAAGKDGTTILGLHTGAETELTLAGALRGLISAFHRSCGKLGLREKRAKISGCFRPVNRREENL